MKYLVKIAAAVGLFTMAMTSCVDEIKFGDSFLEKAPGVDITKDTIFAKGEYARQFLWSAYNKLHIALPVYWGNDNRMNTGVQESFSDCFHDHRDWTGVCRRYYPGTLVAGDEDNTNETKFGYTKEMVWECVRQCWIFINSVDQVPESEMKADEKDRLKAEAKCIIAERYFDMFRHFGGVPIVDKDYEAETSYTIPRATIDETVKFMVKLLDEAIACPSLPWALKASEINTWCGRFTKAGAMGLKAKVLNYAASPIYNDTKPYYDGSAEAIENRQVWYGDYKDERWNDALKACQEFFAQLATNGGYQLIQAASDSHAAYRAAYGKCYYDVQNNTEILLSNRRTINGIGGAPGWDYNWAFCFFQYYDDMSPYCPTFEFMEMFPNADGTPFNFNTAVAEKKVFFDLNQETDDPSLYPTRDPRLYETMRVNGQKVGGRNMQYWEGGRDNINDTRLESGKLATGFMLYKFYKNGMSDYRNMQRQWPYLRLAEMYLLYAEALIQTGNHAEAVRQMDIVRARVGLGSLKTCEPDVIKTKEAMLEALLRERACELSFEDTRFFDLVRYKRKDRLEKQLHGLRIKRADGVAEEWDESKGPYPRDYEYEVYTLEKFKRYWWTAGFADKWFLSAFPPSEVNKGYGLTQNPGW